jgi:hypothetical protein
MYAIRLSRWSLAFLPAPSLPISLTVYEGQGIKVTVVINKVFHLVMMIVLSTALW